VSRVTAFSIPYTSLLHLTKSGQAIKRLNVYPHAVKRTISTSYIALPGHPNLVFPDQCLRHEKICSKCNTFDRLFYPSAKSIRPSPAWSTDRSLVHAGRRTAACPIRTSRTAPTAASERQQPAVSTLNGLHYAVKIHWLGHGCVSDLALGQIRLHDCMLKYYTPIISRQAEDSL